MNLLFTKKNLITTSSNLVLSKKTALVGSVAASVLLFVSAQSANAGLVYDLRVSNSTGSFTTKTAAVDVGYVVTLQLFAIVQGVDNNQANDGLTQSQGSFVSQGPAGIVGAFSAGGTAVTDVETAWRGLGAQNGLTALTNVNGGGFDLGLEGGGSDTGVPTLNPYFSAQQLSPIFGSGAGNNVEFLLGTKTFTVSAAVGSPITLQFAARNRTNGVSSAKPIKFTVDGVAFSVSNGDPNITYGGAVQLAAVPEPSAFGMVLIGALGLVGFRRLGFRRS